MRAPFRMQQHIRNLTNDYELIVRFVVDTVQGKTPGVKACHQMEALKYLDRYGSSDDANKQEPHFWGLIPHSRRTRRKAEGRKSPSSSGRGLG